MAECAKEVMLSTNEQQVEAAEVTLVVSKLVKGETFGISTV